MIFSPHKDFKIAVYLFESDPELHSGTERSSFSDKFRRPGPEPSVLSVILAGSGPVMVFIDNRTRVQAGIRVNTASGRPGSARVSSVGSTWPAPL